MSFAGQVLQPFSGTAAFTSLAGLTDGPVPLVLFLAFVLGPDITIKLFGLGLAVAVLLDALIIRSVLVPAIMLVLGRANWWLPGWLDRVLPHVSVEGPASPTSPAHEHRPTVQV